MKFEGPRGMGIYRSLQSDHVEKPCRSPPELAGIGSDPAESAGPMSPVVNLRSAAVCPGRAWLFYIAADVFLHDHDRSSSSNFGAMPSLITKPSASNANSVGAGAILGVLQGKHAREVDYTDSTQSAL
jgi:hypothetical protein